jgi:hypothetical protein
MMERWKMQPLPTMAMGVALAYGLGGEYFFKQADTSDWIVGTLSISFLFLVPFAIGALTVALSPKERRVVWPYTIFVPWIPCALLGVAVILLAMEAWICVLMGLPLFFVMSSLGGGLMCWLYNRREKRSKSDLLGIVVLLPLLFTPIEKYVQPPTVVREVKASVVVNAPAEVIWDTFVTVPKIQPQEEHFTWFRAAGLPYPVEAILVNPGSEGVRYASYDNGMRVIEPVRVWSPYDRYRFGVKLDADGSQHTPLWSDVAGKHLHVQWVEYQIEKLSEDQVRLHLTSHYVLETPVNPYAALWVDFLLGDFQHYILEIVAARAESQA